MFARKKRSRPVPTMRAANDFFSPIWSSANVTEPDPLGGARHLVLRLGVPAEWLPQMDLDPQLELLLGCLDDTTPLGELLGPAPPRGEMLRQLFELLDEGIVIARVRPALRRA